MSEEIIFKYSNQFKKLRRAYVKGMGAAPHKPILLLSIIQLIAKGVINTNRIFITADLMLAFKQNWKLLVETGHTPNFSLPFFHLRSEPFWYLRAKPGKEIETTSSKSIKSFKYLKESIAFAEINRDLFFLLQEIPNQLWFEHLLLENYFPNAKNVYLRPDRNYEEERIENEILNEPKEEYQNHIQQLKETMLKDEFEEELIVRGRLIKKTIHRINEVTGGITGMRIQSQHNEQMMNACYIYPFSVSRDDTVTNGIALSPTLHRAFDRGLITINSNFVVRISPSIIEEESNFKLSQFDGRQIILPQKEKYYPSQESLVWHNKEVFLL